MINTVKFKKQVKIFDMIKWILSGILITLAIMSYYYTEYSTILKITALIILIILSIGIITLTKTGKKFLILVQDSKQEIKMITWPNLKETLNITLIVIIVTIVIGLILWGLDNILIYLISVITSLRL